MLNKNPLWIVLTCFILVFTSCKTRLSNSSSLSKEDPLGSNERPIEPLFWSHEYLKYNAQNTAALVCEAKEAAKTKMNVSQLVLDGGFLLAGLFCPLVAVVGMLQAPGYLADGHFKARHGPNWEVVKAKNKDAYEAIKVAYSGPFNGIMGIGVVAALVFPKRLIFSPLSAAVYARLVENFKKKGKEFDEAEFEARYLYLIEWFKHNQHALVPIDSEEFYRETGSNATKESPELIFAMFQKEQLFNAKTTKKEWKNQQQKSTEFYVTFESTPYSVSSKKNALGNPGTSRTNATFSMKVFAKRKSIALASWSISLKGGAIDMANLITWKNSEPEILFLMSDQMSPFLEKLLGAYAAHKIQKESHISAEEALINYMNLKQAAEVLPSQEQLSTKLKQLEAGQEVSFELQKEAEEREFEVLPIRVEDQGNGQIEN